MNSTTRNRIGTLLIASGAISFVVAILVGWLIATGRDPMAGGGGVRVIGWILATSYFASMTIGGLLLLRGSQSAHWLVPLALALQVPILQGGPFSYAVIAFPEVVWHIFPEFGPAFSTEARIGITFDGQERPFQLSINVLALLLLIWFERSLDSEKPADEPAG